MFLRPIIARAAAGCWLASELRTAPATINMMGRRGFNGTPTTIEWNASVVSPAPLSIKPGTEMSAAVATMTAANTTPADAIGAMRTLLGGEIVHKTVSHQEILRLLLSHTARLARGGFVGSDGNHARLLQGARGIGKSTVMRAYAHLCQALYPSVIPVYISFANYTMTQSPMRSTDIMKTVAEQLRLRGIAIPGGVSLEQVPNALVASAAGRGGTPLHVLLLIDEVDELYRAPADDTNALSCLGNLAFLGDRRTGMFGVVLSGSSPACSRLIKCNATDALRAEFPLLQGAHDLNGRKYCAWRIPSPLPTDVALVLEMMSGWRTPVPPDEPAARLVAFATGGIARSVGKYADGEISVAGASGMLAQCAEAYDSAQKRVESDGQQLYAAIMVMLCNKNAAVMASLRTDGALDVVKVAAVPWDRDFKPLAWAEVEKCWIRLHKGAGKACDMNQLRRTVWELIDLGLLTYNQMAADAPVPDCVFPASIAQLFIHAAPAGVLKVLLATWDMHVKQALKHLGRSIPTLGRLLIGT